MSITGTSSSSYVAPSTFVQGTSTGMPACGAQGDGDHRSGVHGHHRHGAVAGALMQALQSVGLSEPKASGNTSAQEGQSGGNDVDGTVRSDMHHFMHALFDAVKGEKSQTTDAASGTAGKGATDFSSGLAALISQVSNGSAPPELQSDFDKLVLASQAGGAAGNGSASSSSVTLQQVLTKLQQNLGYGSATTSAFPSTGNLVSTSA